MATTLQVRLTIPITPEFNDGLLFRDWLPSASEVLTVQHGSLRVDLKIDPESCQVGAFRADPAELVHAGDLRIGKFVIDVQVENVADDLAEYIRTHATDDHKARESAAGPLRDAYEALGRSVMVAAIEVIQGVLSLFRVVKGQFWIPKLTFDMENLAGFCAWSCATVRSEGRDWIRWKPSLIGVIRMEVRDWGWRKFRQKDWVELGKFIQTSQKTPLALELLAEAERLDRDGRTRVALIEAVAGLEVAVRRYLATSAGSNHEALLADLDVRSLDALFERLGLRGSLAVLLPLLISKQDLPRDALRESIKAVELRGVVVHRGKRHFRKDEVRSMLHALRKVSMRLGDLASKNPSSPDV